MRELEKVKMIIFNATGLDLGYAYDDLAFSEHGIFIIQFDEENPKTLKCFFNHECNEEDKDQMQIRLIEEAKQSGFSMNYGGKFEMAQKDGKDEISLKFSEA